MKRKKLAEIENQTEFERLWRLKYTELYGDSLLPTGVGSSFVEELADGHTEEDIDLQCTELFFNSPIPFKPRPNQEVD